MVRCLSYTVFFSCNIQLLCALLQLWDKVKQNFKFSFGEMTDWGDERAITIQHYCKIPKGKSERVADMLLLTEAHSALEMLESLIDGSDKASKIQEELNKKTGLPQQYFDFKIIEIIYDLKTEEE